MRPLSLLHQPPHRAPSRKSLSCTEHVAPINAAAGEGSWGWSALKGDSSVITQYGFTWRSTRSWLPSTLYVWLMCSFATVLSPYRLFLLKKKKRQNLKISACMAGILRNPLRTQENEIHCEIIPLNHILINIHWQINIPRHQSVIDQGQCNREGVCVCVRVQ